MTHLALATDAQVALVLLTLGGPTTPEIAWAFLVPEPTMAQRLVVRSGRSGPPGIPFRVPPDHLLPDRLSTVLAVVLAVVYLIQRELRRPRGAGRGGDRARAGVRSRNLRSSRREVAHGSHLQGLSRQACEGA